MQSLKVRTDPNYRKISLLKIKKGKTKSSFLNIDQLIPEKNNNHIITLENPPTTAKPTSRYRYFNEPGRELC